MLYSMVLAGGLSSRMGQEKSRLLLNQKTLLDHSIDLLKTCGSDKVFISGQVKGYECVPDLVKQSGPLGGIYSTIKYMEKEFGLDGSPLLIIPVDMPLLTVEVLQRAVKGLGKNKCCHYQQQVFPCVMKAEQSLMDFLNDAFQENNSGFKKRSMKELMSFLNAVEMETVNFQKEDVFLNVNQPADWQKVQAMNHPH